MPRRLGNRRTFSESTQPPLCVSCAAQPVSNVDPTAAHLRLCVSCASAARPRNVRTRPKPKTRR